MSRKLRPPLAALAIVAVIGAGCSNEPAESGSAGNTNAGQEQAVKFAECMRDNGVSEFPDPDASGGLTIDGVVNGSSLDPSAPAWKEAIGACKDLQPAGFMGDEDISAEEQEVRLEFAQCMRDNGVEDFPDPTVDGPLVDTTRIPSAAGEGGLSIINAAMQTCGDLAAESGGPVKRKTWVLAAAAVLVAVTATGGVVAMSGGNEVTAAAQEPPANTVQVERGKLSAMVSLDGTLTYRARSDGSPYSAINQAGGTYTELPDVGDKVDCGDVLYRVDDDPVLLLCGTVPAYRDLDTRR